MSADVQQVSVSDARVFLESSRLGQRTLLDVRQDFEYAEGHLPGATLIPLPDLAERASELDPLLTTMVYCRSGKRSLAGANLLAGLGFRDVRSMQGGITAWDGAQASGSLDLGLDALLSATTPVEMLERAWGMELALQGFYESLAGQAVDEAVRELFARLASFEVRHRRVLLDVWKRLGGVDEVSMERRAREAVTPGTLEGGLDAGGYLGLLGGPTSPAEALELAMAVEAQAMDLYMRRAKTADDADLRRTLLLLAEEEKAHLKVLGTFVDGRGRF